MPGGQNQRVPRGKRRRQAPASSVWPWWRVRLGKEQLEVDGAVEASLSRHVLNLRPGLVAKPAPEPAPIPVTMPARLPSTDFLLLVRPNYRWPGEAFPWLTRRWPRLAELSLFLPLEVLWGAVGLVWDVTVYGYFRLAIELGAVGREIKTDVQNFSRIVSLVFNVPWRWLPRRRVRLGHTAFNGTALAMPRWAALPQLAIFLVFAAALVLPLKGIATWQAVKADEIKTQALVSQGFNNFTTASLQLSGGNPALAQLDFKSASENFNQALQLLGGLSQELLGLAARLPGAQKLDAAQHLVAASGEVSQAAALTAAAWQQVVDSAPAGKQPNIGAQVSLLQQALVAVKPHLDEAMRQLKAVPPGDWPTELGPVVAAVGAQVDSLESLVQSAVTLPNFLQQVVASPEPRRYVVLFQNSSELRPTGGFMGSLALLEMKNGTVTSVQIPGGGPYDFQGSLKQVVAPPQPLSLVRGTWQLQDANWFFDFPTSAKKVLWFLQQSGGPEADGVVALTPDVVENLLALTGPIAMPQYGKVITAENFRRETQLAVEVEYSRELNKPKQFIADLAPVLFQRVLDLPPDKKFDLVSALQQSLGRRSLQLYFNDPELEANAETYGWGGEVRQVPMDYLAVVRTNIGGGKTDAVTDETIRHNVEVQPDGGLIGHLTLTRSHRGNIADVFEQRANIDYLRFYVPQGAVLLEANGFTPPPQSDFQPIPPAATLDQGLLAVEQLAPVSQMQGLNITQEFGKTVFGGWLRLNPGETRTVTLTYRLPFHLTSESSLQDLRRYTMYFQGQAGVRPVDFQSSLTLPEGWRVRYQDGSAPLTLASGGLTLTSDWTRDEYYGVLLEKLSAP